MLGESKQVSRTEKKQTDPGRETQMMELVISGVQTQPWSRTAIGRAARSLDFLSRAVGVLWTGTGGKRGRGNIREGEEYRITGVGIAPRH